MSNFVVSRRELLKSGALVGGSQAIGASTLSASAVLAPRTTVRDRFWLWGHEAGSHNNNWNLPAKSRITPVEAAYYMAIPNVILVRYEGKPEKPFKQYSIPFRGLREVVWSVVGASGATESEEREMVLEMAERNPNFTGVMMDDFFTGKKEGKVAALTVEELKDLQKRLKKGQKKLNLWVVLYEHQLGDPVADHLKQCDVVTLWTWKASGLDQLSENFEKTEKLIPTARKLLGCYMWDYGESKPMPIARMQKQCEQGLKWLREGRIEGMIFLASCICDLELETVEWTRQWIHQVGNQKLGVGKST